MRRPTLRSVLPWLLACSLLSLGASPNVGDGPANLRVAVGGDVLAALDTGTPLVVTGANCGDEGPWLQVSAGGQLGWISAGLVDLGDGAPGQAPLDGQVNLRSAPLGDVQ